MASGRRTPLFSRSPPDRRSSCAASFAAGTSPSSASSSSPRASRSSSGARRPCGSPTRRRPSPDGEWWRLLTHPFVHVSRYHLLLDGVAVVSLLVSLADRRASDRILLVVASAAASLCAASLLPGETATYGLCGLSGVGHGLMAGAAVLSLREAGPGRPAHGSDRPVRRRGQVPGRGRDGAPALRPRPPRRPGPAQSPLPPGRCRRRRPDRARAPAAHRPPAWPWQTSRRRATALNGRPARLSRR